MAKATGPASQRRRVHRVFGLALLVAGVLFFFHATLLLDFAALLIRSHTWLIDRLGPHWAGNAIILSCFAWLFAIHIAEAAAWGLYLWRQKLVQSFSEGSYFAGVTMTALGYGDVILPPPWRLLSPLIAITGLLKFGCSTAFLFVVIQEVWVHHL